MQKGYFFCGDLLGFKNITNNLNASDLEEKIQQWVSLVEISAKSNGVTQYQLISDTIFASVDDTKEDLLRLVNFVRALLNDGIINSLCIRGDFTFSDSLVYGEAVIRAHELEQEQNWLGALIETDVSLSSDDYKKMNLSVYAAPLRNLPIRAYPTIYWDIPSAEKLSQYTTCGGLTKAGELLNWKENQK